MLSICAIFEGGLDLIEFDLILLVPSVFLANLVLLNIVKSVACLRTVLIFHGYRH